MAILSVQIGKKKVRAAIISETYEIKSIKETAITADISLVKEAASLAEALLCENNIQKNDLTSVCAAICTCAGAVSDIASEFEREIGMSVKSTAAVNALTLGEAYLNADDKSSAILIKVCENKVESGIVLDHRVFADYSKIGGGLGYIVISSDGYECSCGRKGCLEAYLTAKGISRIAKDAGFSGTTLTEIFDAADRGDENAIAAKTAYVSHLACGLTNIINLFQPHELIIMGELTSLGDRLYTPMMEIILREQYTKHSPNKGNVRFSAPSPKTVLIGAALLAR